MKELEFLKVIKNQINSSYIGDDCAYLKEYGLVITQDNLIEDIHFKREWITPFQLGYKSIVVNISDVLASGAKPLFVTVGLSLPTDIDSNFIKEFYKGIEKGLHGAKVVGGDITGSEKIMISITALGTDKGRKISSRKNAKSGDVVITTGKYGLSSAGLKELILGGNNKSLIQAHLEPVLNFKFSEQISTQIKRDYAMMDTSDGLADALYKIAEASNVTIESKYVEGMFDSEDYNLVAVVPEAFLAKLLDYEVIGKVVNYKGYYLCVDGKKYNSYEELNAFDHFGGINE